MTNKFGIGEWEMRNGCKAVVNNINGENINYPIDGGSYNISGISKIQTWGNDGFFRMDGIETKYDLIKPWTETPWTEPEKPLIPLVPVEVASLRDQFAMAALATIHNELDYADITIATAVYRIADAMLAERNKK